MKTFYSVELEATQYSDDTFCGTYDECVNYIKEYEYTQEEARIAKFEVSTVDDDVIELSEKDFYNKNPIGHNEDPICVDIITDWD